MVMSEVAKYIYQHDIEQVNPSTMGVMVLKELKIKDYGLNLEYLKITNFAVVRTYRLIQDGSYNYEGLKMNEKK